MHWARLNSDVCVPLFARTARFDIQPNRFGILGQFGQARKLQLLTTNLTSLVNWDGMIHPNASVELDVWPSNASHSIGTFEFTKENNAKGLAFQIPAPKGGWREQTWNSISVDLTEEHYSYPQSTPWDDMDRLELYYRFPSFRQPLGNYVRVRNIFLRSSRAFRHPANIMGRGRQARRPCKATGTGGKA